jgi:flagellar biosynthesis protein FlhF
MLIGPPGVGKTVTCAKLAARVAVDHHKGNSAPVTLIAADPIRVGAVDQLRAYAERMDATLLEAADGAALSAALAKATPGDLVIIDTPGTNPYSLDELAHLVELSEGARPDTVLVLDASRDADEAAALAEAFRPVKPRRLMTTGLDLARRLGGMLSAADAAELSLAEISLTPRIGGGLRALDAETLAGLLIPDDTAGTARDTGVGAS